MRKSPTVLVTVVIPALNEERHIAACLSSLYSTDFPLDRLEVIVVDANSTDRTVEIVESFQKRYSSLRLLPNPRVIPPAAMNIGIAAASGSIVMRMDAHSEYPRDYIPRCVKLLRESGAGNAGGRVITVPNGKGPWALPVSLVTSNKFGVGGGSFRTGGAAGFVDTVPFGTFNKEVFEKIGLFDERLTRTEDIELNSRLIRAGYRVAYDPSIEIKYKNQATLMGLCRQGFFNGMWIVYAMCLYPATFKFSRFVPFIFSAYLVTLIPFWLLSAAGIGMVAAIPLIVYIAIAGVISNSIALGTSLKLRVACTFLSYHISYGFGTLYGIICMLSGSWVKYLGKTVKSDV